jgi:hypothetical protein
MGNIENGYIAGHLEWIGLEIAMRRRGVVL